MADIVFSLIKVCVLLSTAAVTRAQTFQNPSIDTPTTMKAGSQYEVSCSCVSTGAKVSLTWQRSDKQDIASNGTSCSAIPGDTFQCNSLYTLPARREDNGVNVICKAVQTGNPTPKSYETTLDILAKPRSIINNQEIIENVNVTVNLTCETEANPPANIYDWSFDGVTLSETGPSLEVTVTNNSVGEYMCNATNTVGTSDPIVITLKEKPRTKPVSNVSTPVKSVTVDMVVTLDCQTVANPPATHFNWSFGNVILNETGSSLLINITDDSFFGNYTCVATNTVGMSDPIIFTLEQIKTSPSNSAHSIAAAITTLARLLFILHILPL